jgi:4-alpha-glucanotransferase
MLTREGLLAGAAQPSAERFTIALYAYLTRTPAMLIGVSLADAMGERRPQNMPGTVDKYPSWRIPLAAAKAKPVLLEELPAHTGVRARRGCRFRRPAPLRASAMPPGCPPAGGHPGA